MKNISTILFLCFFSVVYAQDDCNLISQKGDYCFTHEDFWGHNAKFSESLNKMWLRQPKSKKTYHIKLPNLADTHFFLSLIDNKSLKIKPKTLLFIQLAIKKWEQEILKVNYEYTNSRLGIKILKAGQGKFIKTGQEVTVHYTGLFKDGKVFDSSKNWDKPISFVVGTGQVIKGWDEGFLKLRVGDIAMLQIPPDIAYGKDGKGIIPPNTTLYFKIEVLSVK